MKEKLTSRKFWVALTSILVGAIELFSENPDKLISSIMVVCGTVAYIIGEALIDIEKEREKYNAEN